MVDLVGLVGNGGAAVASIVIVLIFLRYMREQRQEVHDYSERLTVRFETLAVQLTKENHDMLERALDTIQRNTEAFARHGNTTSIK